MLPVAGQLVQLLNAFGALLWATTLAVAGYLLGKVLGLVFWRSNSGREPIV
jgi:membrane protein DedA with SNARE-associated domain